LVIQKKLVDPSGLLLDISIFEPTHFYKDHIDLLDLARRVPKERVTTGISAQPTCFEETKDAVAQFSGFHLMLLPEISYRLQHPWLDVHFHPHVGLDQLPPDKGPLEGTNIVGTGRNRHIFAGV
jgi:hypothetical protein